MKRKTSSIRIYDKDYQKLLNKKHKLNKRKGKKTFIADIIHDWLG